MSPWVFAIITVGPLMFLAGFFLRPLFSKGKAVAVFAEVQQSLDSLNTAVAELPAKVAAVVAAGDPQAAQDKADTIAAVTAASQAAVDAINGVGQPANQG